MATEKQSTEQNDRSTVGELLDSLSGDTFQNWYRERQYRQNIENGTPYFNRSGHVPDPERHSPSQLLQCHRKILYRQCNAPSETADPDGIFWFGTQFEEEILCPFLERAVTNTNTYVRNTIWTDFTIETAVGNLQIKGATDPVIVDSDAVPVLPTEIKTKSSIENLTSPDRHHKAQIHAYLIGLSRKYDIDLTEGVLIYGGRNSLDVSFFEIEFDQEFWREVVQEWVTEHTKYRLNESLPPADPEFSWECDFCSYQNRCGKGDENYSDSPPVGFLPLYGDYPKEAVIEYIEAHEDSKLTPSLAHRFPELARRIDVYDWFCSTCSSSYGWRSIEWGGNPNNPPACPQCAKDEIHSSLSGPRPHRCYDNSNGGDNA